MFTTSPLRRSLKKPPISPTLALDIFPGLDLARTFFYSILSGIIWFAIISLNTFGAWIGVIFTGIILFISILFLSKGKITESLSFLIYLAMVQPALRTFVLSLPYLTLEYYFIFWVVLSLGKYSAKQLRVPAVFYLIYLVFEILGLFKAFNPENARSIIVSSMTVGLALLLVDKLYFGKGDLSKLFTAIVIGVANLLVIIGYGYATSTISWGRQSSSAASGGMGPVQISMLLAVGVIILLVMADRVNFTRRLIYIGLAAGISLMMVLTFSRNGLYLSIIALVAYYIVFSKFSWRTIGIIILLSILGIYLFDLAMQVAGTAFAARFSNINTSGRDLLARYGWEIFLDNPIWGVGTSNYYQVIAKIEYLGSGTGAHNELIRAAAEHGIFGLSTWVLFAISSVWMGFQSIGKTRALRMALLIIFFAYISVNGLKLLVLPLILLIGLSSDDF